jgi:tetratricopeptide (TPR) repeat protein
LAREQLELCRALNDKPGMADALLVLGEVVTHQGNADDGRQFIEQALGLAREMGNRQLMARCLSNIIWIGMAWMNDGGRASLLAEEALALYRELGDQIGAAHSLRWLSSAARTAGDVDRAQALFREGLAVLRQLAPDADVQSEFERYVFAAREWGDYAAARALAQEMLDRCLDSQDRRGSAGAYGLLALLTHEQGEYERAESLYEKALAICRELEDLDGVAMALVGLGDVARARGDPGRIIACCNESLALFQHLGRSEFIAYCLHNLGLASWYQGDYGRAEEHLEEAISLFTGAEFVTSLGLVMLDQGRYMRARELFAESLRKRESLRPIGTTATSLEGLAGVAIAQGQVARAGTLLGAADALRARCGTPIWPALRPLYERIVKAVRETQGDKAFQAAWEQGQAMTADQAITYVRDEA